MSTLCIPPAASVSAALTPEICAIVPVYDHPDTIGEVVDALLGHDLRVILVDDGSEARCANTLRELLASRPRDIVLIRHGENCGKGAAVMTGLRQAGALGCTHALQIDADGQHDSGDLGRFLDACRRAPSAVIIGRAVYDDSVPSARLYGRYATHVWVWINTLSLAIRDALCGFRVYPLAPVSRVLDRTTPAQRMEFDVEILVRLAWQGEQFVNLPTRVVYPRDGISHYRPWVDTWHISIMHARLLVGMMARLPRLLWRKVCPPRLDRPLAGTEPPE